MSEEKWFLCPHCGRFWQEKDIAPEPDYEVPPVQVEAEQWLWCLHCQRFFQAKDLTPDFVGGNQGCAFEDCGGAGLGVDIYEWDDWPKQNPELWEHWPKFSELKKGLYCPLYPD